jgi:hypothetical protein
MKIGTLWGWKGIEWDDFTLIKPLQASSQLSGP